MKRGFHWIGRLPSGRFALLYADPILTKTHHEVATFGSHVEGIRYCRKNRIELASTVVRPQFRPSKKAVQELRGRQSKLYSVLLGIMDGSGIAKASHKQLMALAGEPHRGNLIGTLNSLMTKGLVERLAAGWGDEPYTYRVSMPMQTKKPPSEEGGEQDVVDDDEGQFGGFSPAAAGRLGGLARARNLTPERMSEIGRMGNAIKRQKQGKG